MRSIEEILTDKVHSVIAQDRALAVRLHNLAARLAEVSVADPESEMGLHTLIAEAKDINASVRERTTPKPYSPTGRQPSAGPNMQTNAPRTETGRAIREAFTN